MKSKTGKKIIKNKIGKIKLSKSSLYDEFVSDPSRIRKELAYCLERGDQDSFFEILTAFVDSCNKSKLARVTTLSRNTLNRIRTEKTTSIDTTFKILKAVGNM